MSGSTLILCGHKSSGKTYFGRLFAQEIGTIFIDTDQLTEELYTRECQENLSCREIVLKMGEDGFRILESRVINSLDGVTNAVVSVGGGAVLSPENCCKLQKLGVLVYLEQSKEIIKQRIFNGAIPTFLDPSDLECNLECAIDAMYEERKPIYTKVSTVTVNIQGKTDRQVLDELFVFNSLYAKNHQFILNLADARCEP